MFAFVLLLSLASDYDLVFVNETTSVQRGIYLRADAETGTYVSFCLGKRHRDSEFYPHLCSPDNPDGTRNVKRVASINPDGSLIVEGNSELALDSADLGPIRADEIETWWRPLVQIGRGPDGEQNQQSQENLWPSSRLAQRLRSSG